MSTLTKDYFNMETERDNSSMTEANTFPSGELECGHFEMRREKLSFSHRASMIFLGLQRRSQKICSKLNESRKQYLTENLVGILSLIVLLFILFCVLSHIISQNTSLIRGKFTTIF